MRSTRGFTLVEMMVVIVIIGVIAAIVIVNIAGKTDEAKKKTTEAMIKQLAQQVSLFRANHNVYPRSLDDLNVMPPYIDQKTWPPGGYLTEPPRDGWGREFLFRVPGTEGAPFDIVSFGADGKEGGEGVDEDLSLRKRVVR